MTPQLLFAVEGCSGRPSSGDGANDEPREGRVAELRGG
jgi:hypothetical protein